MKAAAKSVAAPLPTVAQTIFLLVDRMEGRLRSQMQTRAADEHWSDDDVLCDLACALALERVTRMKVEQCETYCQFEDPWCRASSALELSKLVFSRKDCAYFRGIDSICALFRQGLDIVEFVESSSRLAEKVA